MLEWLKESPGFPEMENADFQNREAGNPRRYWVFPVSRFSRFLNEGAAQQLNKTADACEKNACPISQPIPELLDAVAARLGRLAAEDLQKQAGGNADHLAELCRLVLAAPPSPTPDAVAELDRLMAELCELEPLLAGYLPEMQAARRSMAAANVAASLEEFRRLVREAEARRGAVGGAGIGKPSAPKRAGA